jgi:HicB family
VPDRDRRRYAERGVDRERLRLRVDRQIAARLRAAAAAHGLSVNAFTESLLAGHLATADTDSAPALPQPTDRVCLAAPPADPPTRAIKP